METADVDVEAVGDSQFSGVAETINGDYGSCVWAEIEEDRATSAALPKFVISLVSLYNMVLSLYL